MTLKEMTREIWPEIRNGRAGVTLTAIATIVAYVGVMALTYNITEKPVFAIAYTNAFTATCVILWRKRHKNTLATLTRKHIPTFEGMAIPVIIIITNLGATLIALWVKQTLNYPSPMQPLTQTTPAIVIIVMSLIVAPIGEEALMRGFLYPLLRTRFSAASTIAITTVMFALLHGNLIQVILTIPLGIALGYLYEKTHNLTACISAHMLFNTVALMLPNVTVGTTHAGIAMALLLITFILWVYTTREIARRKEARQAQ